MKRSGFVAMVGVLLFAGQAVGQEIRCNQVFMNPSETHICASEDLLQLDREMAQAYRRAEPHMPDIKKAQKAFRKGLKLCKGDDACLVRSYDARNTELRAFINTLPMATQEEARALGEAADEVIIDRGEVPVVEQPIAPPVRQPVAEEPEKSAEEPIPDAPPNAVVQEPVPPAPAATSGSPWWAYVIGLFVIWVILMWIWEAWSKSCPECHKWSAGVEFDRDISRHRDFDTVTRIDRQRDGHGKETGTIERKEQVVVRVTTTTHHMRCKFCRNEWHYDTTKVSE